MTIHEKIKALRKSSGLTQEALAAALNISYQSVSKWESAAASPDISHLVPLANLFGVTLDELFDRGRDTEERDLAAYLEKEQQLSHDGLIEQRLELWQTAAAKYPNNHTCLRYLANALWKVRHLSTIPLEVRTEYLGRSIAINERLVKEADDLSVRFGALQILVFSLSDPTFPFADEQKAVEYANMAPSFYCSREMFLERAYFSEENREKARGILHQSTLMFLDCISQNIRTQEWKNPNERIEAYETVVKLWNTLIPDGNFLFYHCRLAETHTTLAGNYAILGDREHTLSHLVQAYHHAVAYESQESGEVHYTVPWLTSAYADRARSTKSAPVTQTEQLKHALNHDCYDFLRRDPDFTAIVDALK